MALALTYAMSDVLIVDDDLPTRHVLRRFLEPAGHEVREAADAGEALQAIADAGPDVALCDVHMPGANGLWLADQIRRTSPFTAIVLVTGDGNIAPAESFRQGVVAYVLKPLQYRELLQAVDDGLRWSARERRTRPAAGLRLGERAQRTLTEGADARHA